MEAKKAEAERIEAAKVAFKKREDVDIELCKATVKVQREAKAKVRKEAAAAKKLGLEKAEGLGKRGREEREISVTVGSFLTQHGVEWMDGEGKGGMRVMRKEREEVFLEDGGRAGQGLPCLP